MKKMFNNKRGAMAVSQIIVMLIGIVAIGWAIGSEMGRVSGGLEVGDRVILPNGQEGFVTTIAGDSADVADLFKEGSGLGTFSISQLRVVSDVAVQGEAPLTTSNPVAGSSLQNAINPYTGGIGGTATSPVLRGYIDISGQRYEGNLFEQGGNYVIKDEISNNFVTVSKNDAYTAFSKGQFGSITSDGKVGGEYFYQTSEGYFKISSDSGPHKLSYGDWSAQKSISETGDTPKWGEPGGFGGAGTFFGALWTGVKWAGVVGAITGLISLFAGESATMDALVPAATVGAFVGGTLSDAWGKGGIWEMKETHLGMGGQGWGITAGLVTTAILFVMLYKDTSQELVTFTCYPWDAPSGGNDCKKCNSQGILPCSEYQCRSLGQSCQLLNPGTTEESCEWVNRHDVEPPIMEPLESVLTVGYKYTPDNTVSPPDRGVYIKNTASTTGCVKAFTPLSFGVWTHDNNNVGEPAICKADYIRKDNFDNMTFYFGGSPLFLVNHTQVMSLPGPSALQAANLTIQNGGNYSLYVRCQDANGNANEGSKGNANVGTLVFKFCVEEGPDTTPPIIVTTNLLNGLPVAFNQSSLNLEVYTNEPADCKWSRLDQTYEKMEETMSCSKSVLEMNAQMLYKCKTTLTGIKSEQENKYYFRCEDKPGQTDRNKMEQSYEFSVIGTRPLILDSVSPDGKTIKDATNSVKVTLEAKTSSGYKDGEAFCYFSDTGDEDSYIKFLNTGTWDSTQDLYLPEGDYTYYIKCVDLGGNFDSDTVSFSVDSDTEAPQVVRAYHAESYLKIVTDEDSNCVYDNVDCSYPFEDGKTMNSANGNEHYVDWDIKKNYYIKCEDTYGNKPAGNECSFIARPFEIGNE